MVWAVFGLYFYRQLFFSDADIPYQYWIKQTVTLSLLVTAFYLNSFLLVPRFLLKNHAALYIVIIISIVAAIAFMNRWVDNVLSPYQFNDAEFYKRSQPPAMELLRHPHPPKRGTGYHFRLGDLFTIIISGLVVGISTTITAVQKWQRDNQERKELEKDKITTELSLLKAQINPHFFFNTLNNIYVLTAVDPKIAGEAIHQLSKMMRYLLYDTQKGDTMLSQEIAFVKNYISLMKLRLTDVVKINIDIPTNVKDMPLAPMIFLPFVENAFKHGVSATQQSYINIIIFQKDKVLDLTVNNSIMKDNSVSLDGYSGIGLVNTRRRLDLLYPGMYKLDISDRNATSEYTVHLVLDLS
ncbi:MAG: sensor histidine kinase [Chitinophagaceae bacterium]|nr:sensor histidine kinase [Chitinophagaceae bacterium]